MFVTNEKMQATIKNTYFVKTQQKAKSEDINYIPSLLLFFF